MKIQCQRHYFQISILIQLYLSKLLFIELRQLLLQAFLPLPYILLYKLTDIQHQSHHFYCEVNAYLYHSRRLWQTLLKYLFLAVFSYLLNNFFPQFYYISFFKFMLSYLLVCFLNPSACSFYINHILLNQVQMDQILFLLFIDNNALKLFIFFIFFFLLTLISHQLT